MHVSPGMITKFQPHLGHAAPLRSVRHARELSAVRCDANTSTRKCRRRARRGTAVICGRRVGPSHRSPSLCSYYFSRARSADKTDPTRMPRHTSRLCGVQQTDPKFSISCHIRGSHAASISSVPPWTPVYICGSSLIWSRLCGGLLDLSVDSTTSSLKRLG